MLRPAGAPNDFILIGGSGLRLVRDMSTLFDDLFGPDVPDLPDHRSTDPRTTPVS